MIISKENIESLISEYEKRSNEIDECCGEDFDVMDASGGNFDDAYQLGYDHGVVSGALSILYQLVKS